MGLTKANTYGLISTVTFKTMRFGYRKEFSFFPAKDWKRLAPSSAIRA